MQAHLAGAPAVTPTHARRARGRQLALLVAALVAAAAPAPAAARPSEAEALRAEGERLLAARRYAEACAKLEASLLLERAPGTLIALAECHDGGGQLEAAWQEAAGALRLARDLGLEGVTARARVTLAALERRLGIVTIVVPAPAQAFGLVIRRDGVALAPAEWGRAAGWRVGPHTVTAEAPELQPWRRDVVVTAGGRLDIVVPALVAGGGSAPPASAPLAGDAAGPPATQSRLGAADPEDTGDAERPPPPLAPRRPDAGDPVERAACGDLGFFFRFGGLATLEATGNSRAVGQSAVVLTQVGFKLVRGEDWMFPIYFGTGVRVDHSTASTTTGGTTNNSTSSATDVGLDLGAGFEYHFRIRKRISPFVGATVGFTYTNPSGKSNDVYGVGFGPTFGVEYYLADRVSLTAQYLVTFQVAYEKASASVAGATVTSSVTSYAFQTLAGGAMNLTYYF
jgi:hypothetical protein